MGDTASSDGGATTLDDRSQVLVLAAEMAAEQGVDLGAFLKANPDVLDELDELEVGPPSDTPIDLSDLGEDDVP